MKAEELVAVGVKSDGGTDLSEGSQNRHRMKVHCGHLVSTHNVYQCLRRKYVVTTSLSYIHSALDELVVSSGDFGDWLASMKDLLPSWDHYVNGDPLKLADKWINRYRRSVANIAPGLDVDVPKVMLTYCC